VTNNNNSNNNNNNNDDDDDLNIALFLQGIQQRFTMFKITEIIKIIK